MVAAQSAQATKVVNTLAAVGGDLTPNPSPPRGIVYNTDSKEFSVTSGAYPATIAGAATTPVLDDGRDLGVEQRNLQANVNTLKVQLDAFTFDPKTGAQVYTVQGAARESL